MVNPFAPRTAIQLLIERRRAIIVTFERRVTLPLNRRALSTPPDGGLNIGTQVSACQPDDRADRGGNECASGS